MSGEWAWVAQGDDDFSHECAGRRCEDCHAGDCVCACHITETRRCNGCGQMMRADVTGFCDDCQSGVVSQRPGSLTPDQRIALAGLLIDQGLVGKWKERARVIGEVVPNWRWGGDLGVLSQQQAADLLEHLEERRLSQEARGL